MIRDSFVLPQKEDAALFQNVNYNVPGLFLYSELLLCLLDLIREKFGYEVPIKFMYGAPQTRWNGGRLILNKYKSDFSLSGIEKELISISKRGITPLLTFSNVLIEEDDLQDEYCNQLLKMMSEIGAGAIVSSDLLAKYIKTKYPEIQLHQSVISTAFKKNRDELFYKEISSSNSYYVVHPDDNFDMDLLKKIPKSNAEIIINERCFYRCNQRNNHYISISSDQRKQNNNEKKYSDFLSGCNAMPEIKQGASKQNNISLSIDEIKSIVELGFTSLKIQGRSDSLYSFFFDFLRYTLEPNVAFPNMYNIFVQYIENYLKGV